VLRAKKESAKESVHKVGLVGGGKRLEGGWKSGKAAKGLQVGNLETIMHTRAYREKRSPKSVARETRLDSTKSSPKARNESAKCLAISIKSNGQVAATQQHQLGVREKESEEQKCVHFIEDFVLILFNWQIGVKMPFGAPQAF